MKKAVWLGLGAIVAVSALFAACGGDDDDGDGDNSGGSQTSDIRTEKGAAVQAIVANLSGSSGIGGDDIAESASGAGAPRADGALPATGSNLGVGGGGTGADSAGGPAAPAQQTGTNGLTVQGFGSATADADSASVEFYFGNYGTPEPVPPIIEGDQPTTGAAGPITEEDLQPVIDALVNAGVPRDDIEIVEQPYYYYDPYYQQGTLRATINDVAIVDAAVQAATEAASGLGGISLQSTNIMYTVQDCTALEQAALGAAAEDAAERAGLLAEALDVGLGGIIGAANYSYYGYGSSSCGSSYYGPYYNKGVDFSTAGSPEVQVFEQISVTYAMQ